MLGRPATPPQTPPSASFRNLSPCPAFRNLGPDHLAGVIFTCTDDSFNNCIEAGVFGLPRNHFQYVQYVRASMVLFLFNYNTRELHGIFRAVTQGKLDGRPGKVDSRWATSFPAQVYVDTSDRYQPLPEAAFKLAIMDNYHSNSSSQFAFELDTEQVAHISELFKKMSSTNRFNASPQLSPLAHSPCQTPVNPLAFLEGQIGAQQQNPIWDGLPPQNWNGNDSIPANLQSWEPALAGPTATNVAALSAQIAQEPGLNYSSLPVQIPQQSSNVWQMTGTTPGHQSPLAGTNLGGLDGWVQSPMHADASPRSQVWANLGGPLSPVMALTPRAGTPGGSSTPTGVWGQQSIWSARPGDPFGGLSWTSGQTNVAPGASLSLGNPDISSTGLMGSNPSLTEAGVDRRGWGSLLDGSGTLMELKATEGSPESHAKNADKLITFGSLVAKEEDLEALIEADEDGEAADTISFLAEATRGHALGLYREGGAKEGWKDDRDLVTHGWTDSGPAVNVNGGVDAEGGESGQMEDKMLERISSLPRIKTGRDGGAGNELEKMIAAVSEMNGRQPQPGGPTENYTQPDVPEAAPLNVAGAWSNANSAPSDQLPPKAKPIAKYPSIGRMKLKEEGEDLTLAEYSQGAAASGATAPLPASDIYKNVINNLTSEVADLKEDKALLLKEKEFIKGQLEQANVRLLLIQANNNKTSMIASKSCAQQDSADVAADGDTDVQKTTAKIHENLWIVGGVTAKQKVCRKAEVYAPQKSKWLYGPKVPMGLCYGAAVGHGSYIFVLGGVDTSEPYGERANMWTINVLTGMISESTPLLGPRTKLGAAKIDGQIYAIGGLSNAQTLQTVEVYDPMQDRWLPGPKLNNARRAFGTALTDSVIYAAGGIDKNAVVKTVEMMDPREGKWQVVGTMKEPRAALACAPMCGDVLVLGGYSDGQVLSSAEVFDVRQRKSIPAVGMAQGRSYCTATCLENHIYVVGGRTSVSDDDSAMADMECYSIKDNTWSLESASGQTELRAFHSACAVEWGGD